MQKTFLIVNSTDFSKPNATQNRFLAIARGLYEEGNDVIWILLASEVTPDVLNKPFYQGIRFLTLGNATPFFRKSDMAMYLYRILLHLKIAKLIKEVAKNGNPIVWFDYGSRIPFLWQVIRISKNPKVILTHEKGEYPHLGSSLRDRINQKYYMNRFIPQCEYVFVNSVALKSYFDKHLKHIKRLVPVHILNIIVEPDRFSREIPLGDSRHRDIVYIGTPYGTKDGVYDLVRSFSLIMGQFPDTRLVIVGDTARRDMLQQVFAEIAKLSEPDRVILTGHLGTDAVAHKINSAYCLALARPDNIQAKYGFPTKLGEYLSTGRPVVITGVGDIPLFLKDGYNAYVAKPGDIEAFAEKLSQCLSSPLDAEMIGLKGRELIDKDFNYRVVASKLSKIIDESAVRI